MFTLPDTEKETLANKKWLLQNCVEMFILDSLHFLSASVPVYLESKEPSVVCYSQLQIAVVG